MKRFIYIFCFLFSVSLFAQDHETCDGDRYKNVVFSEVQSTTALKFGEGTTIAGNFQELFMDIYEPVGDVAEKRPAIILAFGGSYIQGNREQLGFLCEQYAQRGFVAATIDYRLYDLGLIPLPTEAEMKDVVSKSISDMKAAIRYLREDADTDNQFRIDPDLIFVGGVSAGAITAAHTAVMDETDEYPDDLLALLESNGGLEGNSSDNLQYSSEVSGFISFSGGLNDASWIDSEDPPFFAVHDEFDDIVPYGGGFASVLGFEIVYLEGGQVMNQQADIVGVTNELHTLEGSAGHVSYFFDSDELDFYVDLSAQFLHDEILCPAFTTNTTQIDPQLAAIRTFPNPSPGFVVIDNIADLNFEVQLFNSVGQALNTWSNVQQLNLSDYQAGIYFLEITNLDTNLKVTKKIVRN